MMSLEQLQPTSRRRRVVRVAMGFTLAVAVCGYLDLRGFNYFEQYAYNLRQTIYAKRHRDLAAKARKRIALVTLSDDTPSQFGPPAPRDCHAKIIRELTDAGVKVIVFDLIFDSEKPQDAAFAAAVREAQAAGVKVLWASLFENENSPRQRLVRPNPRLREASPHWGHVNVSGNVDSADYNRVEAVRQHKGQRTPALSLKAVIMAKGLENQPIRRVEGQWRVGDYRIPVDSIGHFHIRFLGEPDETFLRVPYESVYAGVLNAGVSAEVYRPIFRNKMVLVGDATTGTGDRLKTPVGDMAGVEMHAHAVATLLQRGFVRVAPPWVNFGVLCLLTAIVCPLAAVWRLQWAALVTAGLMAGYSLFNVWLFVDHDLWLHWVAPSAAMVMAKLGVFLERGLTEEREKKRMLGLLQRYVSPQIAAYVIDHPDKCILGGEQVTATVLFSDIRGFTAMSEKLTPKQVVERLNEYLQAMTDVVFERDGAVDKYVGDCIMALFGIPVPHLDHARRAVATAIDMQAALLKLQAKWRAEGLPLIEIGVGVNTGEMVVGNIGAQQRLDFTVIGDAVNLASRVESLNKEMHTRILITESTYQFVKDEVEARGPLTAHVKGKEEEIVVYEVFGWRTPSEGEGNLQRSVRVYVN